MSSMELWNQPVTLEGKTVRLEPLCVSHTLGLAEAGKNETIWKYMLYGTLTNPESMRDWVNLILLRQVGGTDLPFTVFSSESGQVIGATRYMEMRPEHRGLEIGGTWYAPEFQRTRVNTECKYLMLKYAFEELGCIRVQFKADRRNEQSKRAIQHLGARCEGVLRNHYILKDGTFRDSVYFSILDHEWLATRKLLEQRLIP
jgi:RimJ/RimL family protein N-acetyltransferase